MKTNNIDFTRGGGNKLSSTAAVRETHEMGADRQVPISEEELYEYLVTKYQNQFPLTDDRKQEFQQDHRLLADYSQTVVKRKTFDPRPGDRGN